MRYSLLSFIVCPRCAGELVCITREEASAPLAEGLFPPAERVNGVPGVGPLPPGVPPSTQLGQSLTRHATPAAPLARALDAVVQSGLLACPACESWYPIEGGIPELLPDHLRSADREAEMIGRLAAGLPLDLRDALARFRPGADGSSDGGAHYKRAEISIKTRIDDPNFFGPGFSSPFNPWNPEFSLYLIKLFGVAVRTLDLKRGEVLLDSGCGYSWTTEWFFKSGINAIGVDICRTYLEIGIQRMGPLHPHLLVADVEHLPIKRQSVEAVLAYESFHHLPDRRAAMGGYDRVLKPGGRVVLAEPGAAHENAPGSVDVMAKYGILEKGMELDDVRGYADGTAFEAPEQIFVTATRAGERGTLDSRFLRTHSILEGNLFRLVKTAPMSDQLRRTAVEVQRAWPKVKRRIRAAMIRAGLASPSR